MKNSLVDLNNHLFLALERLNDDSIQGENLETEMNRSKTITMVSKSIIENASLMLEAKKHFDEYGINMSDAQHVPEVLLLNKNNSPMIDKGLKNKSKIK